MKALTLLQFLQMLAGVDKHACRSLIGDGLAPFIATGTTSSSIFRDTITLKGQPLHRDELVSLGVNGRLDSAAADAILRLYKAGALPMAQGKDVSSATEAETYVEAIRNHEAHERAEEQRLAAERRQIAERHREIIADPSKACEAEFSISLLNDIFLRHHGPGAGTMSIGGLSVTKSTPIPYASNSGKSRFWSYSYRWTSADGTPRALEQTSPFEGNRRNDADRNWGLGRG